LSEGIPYAETELRPGVERFLKEGLLEAAGGRLRLTARGVLLSNEVFAEFV
jgi:coproporphyrinogen III oxidase-like Fe-S oxidoreductase